MDYMSLIALQKKRILILLLRLKILLLTFLQKEMKMLQMKYKKKKVAKKVWPISRFGNEITF